MMGHEREIAGVAVSIGALLLIWQGEIASGTGLLGALVGFFIGEKNGAKKASEN